MTVEVESERERETSCITKGVVHTNSLVLIVSRDEIFATTQYAIIWKTYKGRRAGKHKRLTEGMQIRGLEYQ